MVLFLGSCVLEDYDIGGFQLPSEGSTTFPGSGVSLSVDDGNGLYFGNRKLNV